MQGAQILRDDQVVGAGGKQSRRRSCERFAYFIEDRGEHTDVCFRNHKPSDPIRPRRAGSACSGISMIFAECFFPSKWQMRTLSSGQCRELFRAFWL